MVTLKDMIDVMPTVRSSQGGADVQVLRLCYSSREVTPDSGSVFFALKGETVDGHQYIEQAREAGAVGIVAETAAPEPCDFPWVQVRDSREALARAAAAVQAHPSKGLRVAGVTGTNGKTTVAFLLHYLLKRVQHYAGMLGTVHYDVGSEYRKATHTTPESVEIQSLLAEMRDAGCRSAVMEVSSHALSQHRVDSVLFDAGIFTNFTQDHLDYHKTMDAYFEAKALLGELLVNQGGKKKPVFVINKDDGYGQRLIRRFKDRVDVVTYGMGVGCDFRATRIAADVNGTRFELEAKGRTFMVRLPLIGRYNVYNVLSVLAATKAMGLNLRESVQHLEEAPQVPGRLEAIDHIGGFKVYVDYAHTPDALENVLKILRDLSPRRLICVFGCGGNRDREKRKLMGMASRNHADVSVVTSDNPRNEDPEAIINDIGAAFGTDYYVKYVDRREAIRRAIAMALPGDIVVVAGKGHEAEQQFATETVPFDDRDEVFKALQVLDLNPRRAGGRPR
ncbi:MAG: UDP-N-acetylmuramoyl-L-alanyl-D-glutamate--2,6-diaminopimelate ligase [Verrucomicrobiaceae bacterium]|nr:UDP-N-acetylmuramoyl-L-alanyl-D-glutamate--2,6-diaminopimelate ligase [Verrucomicrobiaceae bacterium]